MDLKMLLIGKTRTNSHYKQMLDLILMSIALRRKKPSIWWLLAFISYFDIYDPFLYNNDYSHLSHKKKEITKNNIKS